MIITTRTRLKHLSPSNVRLPRLPQFIQQPCLLITPLLSASAFLALLIPVAFAASVSTELLEIQAAKIFCYRDYMPTGSARSRAVGIADHTLSTAGDSVGCGFANNLRGPYGVVWVGKAERQHWKLSCDVCDDRCLQPDEHA